MSGGDGDVTPFLRPAGDRPGDDGAIGSADGGISGTATSHVASSSSASPPKPPESRVFGKPAESSLSKASAAAVPDAASAGANPLAAATIAGAAAAGAIVPAPVSGDAGGHEDRELGMQREMVAEAVPPVEEEDDGTFVCSKEVPVIIKSHRGAILVVERGAPRLVEDGPTQEWLLSDAGDGLVFIRNVNTFECMKNQEGTVVMSRDQAAEESWSIGPIGNRNKVFIKSQLQGFLQDSRGALQLDYTRDDALLLNDTDEELLAWTIAGRDGTPACFVQRQRSEEFILGRYESLMERTRQLPYRMQTKANTLRAFQSSPAEQLEVIVRYAENTRPILHPRAFNLILGFIDYKQQQGRTVEFYKEMDHANFLQRLLTLRPLMSVTSADKYFLRDGKTRGYGVPGPPRFEDVGTEAEKSPLVLAAQQSCEEAEVSALLGVSAPTLFINSGITSTGERGADGSYESHGIYVGMIGPRFERPYYMEWKHMVVTQEQNTAENGYGTLGTPDPLLQLWAKFYKVDCFYTYEEAQRACEASDKRFVVHTMPKTEEIVFIDVEVYRARFDIIAEMFLAEANERARYVNAQAFCHIVPLEVGPGLVLDLQMQIQVDAYAACFERMELNHVGELYFSGFGADLKSTTLGVSSGGIVESAGGQRARIVFGDRGPASKLPHQNVRSQRWLLVAQYAWSSNSYPGNEYWNGELGTSSSSLAAACSLIPELQNPDVNAEAVNGEKVHFVPRPVGNFHSPEALRVSLQHLSLRELEQLAAQYRIEEMLLNSARDAESPSQALIDLIVEAEIAAELERNPPVIEHVEPSLCRRCLDCFIRLWHCLQDLTARSLAWLARTCEWVSAKLVDLNTVLSRVADALDRWVDERTLASEERAVRKELAVIADEPDRPRALAARSAEESLFSAEDVLKVFRSQRPRESIAHRILRGDPSTFGNASLYATLTAWVCIILFAIVLHFIIACFVFAKPEDYALDASGTIFNPSLEHKPSVTTASAVGLRILPDYPLLSLSELRMVEDVRFTHNQATHTLHVVSVARTITGSVELTGADGSVILVESDGRVFWTRKNQARVRLWDTEHWRTSQSYDPSSAWLISGTFAAHVTT